MEEKVDKKFLKSNKKVTPRLIHTVFTYLSTSCPHNSFFFLFYLIYKEETIEKIYKNKTLYI